MSLEEWMSFFDPREMDLIWNHDRSISVLHNPRIRRWVVVQDLSKIARPRQVLPDQNLIGAPGINPGQPTFFKYLFKCETDHEYMGQKVPLKVNGAWIVQKLREKTRAARPDLSDFTEIEQGDAVREAEEAKVRADWLTDEKAYVLAKAKHRVYNFAGKKGLS